MIIIAKFPVQLNDHIYHKGEKCDYDGPVTARIADNFTDAEGGPLAAEKSAAKKEVLPTKEDAEKAAVKRTVEVMGRDGIKHALDALNVPYSPNTGTEYLARQLLAAKGEIEA